MVLALLPCEAWAQVAELGQVGVEYQPGSQIGADPRQEIRVLLAHLSVQAPVPIATWMVLLPGASYELLDFGSRGVDVPRLDTLHDLTLSLGTAIVVSDRIVAVASVGGGYAAEGFATDDLLLTFSAVGTYAVSDTLRLGAGVAYDGQTGSILPIPLVSLELKLSHRTRLRGLVPTLLVFEHRAADWLTAGVVGSLNGNRYHLDPAKYHSQDPELAYAVYSVAPRLSFSFTPALHADIYAGIAVFRRFEVFENRASVGANSLKPGAAGGLRLWVGLEGWDAPRSHEDAGRSGALR